MRNSCIGKLGFVLAVMAFGCPEGVILAEDGHKHDKGKSHESMEKTKPQSTCPIMGGKINKKLFVDAKGKRIYVCCAGCTAAVKRNPDAALKELADKGQHAETLLKPQTTCPIMGGKINKKLFVDAKGKRIYVCCKGCIDTVRKGPDAALKKLADKDEAAEKIQEPDTSNPNEKTGDKKSDTTVPQKPRGGGCCG